MYPLPFLDSGLRHEGLPVVRHYLRLEHEEEGRSNVAMEMIQGEMAPPFPAVGCLAKLDPLLGDRKTKVLEGIEGQSLVVCASLCPF